MLPLDVEGLFDLLKRLGVGLDLAAIRTLRRFQAGYFHGAFNAVVISGPNVIDDGFKNRIKLMARRF